MVGSTGAISLLFAGMDIFSTRAHSAATAEEAAETVKYQRQVLENMRAEGANQDQLNQQMQEVNAAIAFQNRTAQMNKQAERKSEYSAGGMVAGSLIGAALGSIVPGVGTTIGGIIGGVLGEWAGSKIADTQTEMETNKPKTNFLEDGSEGIAQQKKREENFQRWQNGELGDAGLAKAQQERHAKLQKHDENMQKYRAGQMGDAALSQAHNNLVAKNADYEKQKVAAEERHQQLLKKGKEIYEREQKVNANWQKATGYNSLYGNKKFTPKTAEEREALDAYKKEKDRRYLAEVQAKKQAEPKEKSFFEKVGAQVQSGQFNPFAGTQPPMLPEIEISKMLPDFNFSQWWAEKTAGIQSLDFSQLWADTKILPDIDVSGWLSEKFSAITPPDFSPITTSATTAFESLKTSANEKLDSIKTAWNELPGFFSGVFGGLGGVASTAGSMIASGINSGIGMIKSAWESLSGWLSEKISSLSSMASNAASAVGIKIGGNYKGTSYFEGGWTEVNEHGGELMILPTGTKIYPHATTKRILQQEIQQKIFSDEVGNIFPAPKSGKQKSPALGRSATFTDILADVFKTKSRSEKIEPRILNQNSLPKLESPISQSVTKNLPSDELGNLRGIEIPEYNRITLDDDLLVRASKCQAQLEQLQHFESPFNFESANFPVPNFEVPKVAEKNNTTTNNSTPTFNFGDVQISNGMDFDAFVHQLQKHLAQSAANSAQV